eukprot:TRINITY_DN830_c0_g1_i5.p1 TRINITY_DN830_c0_g1~~TRINITY_DN830_c0_g1_i5.p1  ORF type:complete len:766 (+),score=178.53 TRINITY_DN830_c0_g1_i5:85-2298(+)
MDPAIAAALEEAGLSDCLEALQRNEVLDFDTLSSLTDDDLACVVSDPDKRGAMMRALEGIGGAPAAPPAGTQRRRSSAQRQGLARYQSLLRRRGELMRSGAREGLPELEAELEGLRESLGTGEALGSETSRGDRVRLVHDVAQLTANCVSGAQLATQWAGRIATVDSIGLDGSLTLRLPNNRTCSVRPQAVCPPSAGDPRRPSAARDAWGPRPQRRSSAASTAPAAAAAAAAQQAAPAGSAFPLSPQSEAPPRPRPARPRRSRQAASQPTPKPGSPRGFSEPGEREPWGRPVPFGERHRRRAAEARRYGVSRGCRTDPYCLQGTTMSLASTLRRGQRPAVAPPAAAPASGVNVTGASRREMCRVEVVLRPDVTRHGAARLLRSPAWLARGVIADSLSYGLPTDKTAHRLSFSACTTAEILAPYLPILCDGMHPTAVSWAFVSGGAGSAPCPCPAPAPQSQQQGDAPQGDSAAQQQRQQRRSDPAAEVPGEEGSGVSSGAPSPCSAGSPPPPAAPAAAAEPAASQTGRRASRRSAAGSRRGTASTAPIGTTRGPARRAAAAARSAPSCVSASSPAEREEDRVRRRIFEAREQAAKLRGELGIAQSIREEQQQRVAAEESRHSTACRVTSQLLEHHGVVCGELGKLWQALEQVLRTLGQFSSQWSAQLREGPGEDAEWIGRGVLSELMATSAELLDRMRELKRLRRLAARDPSRTPGDGLTGRRTMPSPYPDSRETAEP